MMKFHKLSFAGFAVAAIAFSLLSVDFASAQSSAGCDAYARRFAHRATDGGGAGDALRSGIGGALSGAIIGGLIGGGRGAGQGAIIGGGVGIVAGAASGSAAWRAAYDDAYADCMEGRSGPVAPRPAAWTPEWYDYCAAKFRSFNPDTGMYRTYSGEDRLCR